jgi:hypothetical protein
MIKIRDIDVYKKEHIDEVGLLASGYWQVII